MSEITVLKTRREREVSLTYDGLGNLLHQRYGWKPSKRFLQERRADGMPHFYSPDGRARFFPSQALTWLEEWCGERGRSLG